MYETRTKDAIPMQNHRLRRRAGVIVALSVGAVACAAPRPGAEPSEAAIVAELDASAERWNAGDLDGFLAPYLNDSRTSFVTADGVIRGLDAIEARYRASYWKDGAPADMLRFADVEVRQLGPEHAFAVGRFLLSDRSGAPTGEGHFTVVLTRTPDGWRIVHDHSS